MIVLGQESYLKISQIYNHMTMAKHTESLKIDDLLVEYFGGIFKGKYYYYQVILSFENKEHEGLYDESIYLYLDTKYQLCLVKGILKEGVEEIGLNLEENTKNDEKHKEQSAYVEAILKGFDKYLEKIK